VEQLLELSYALDTFYFLMSGALVMWMAAGFSMLEAGMVRSKNTAEILAKNIALFAVASIMYMLVGYGIMYPGDNAVSSWWPGLHGILSSTDNDVAAVVAGGEDAPYYSTLSDFFFQVVFVATAMSVVSGAVAERMKLWAFLAFAVVMTGFIYPIQGYWKWGGGFLDGLGFSDFAGSGVVHLAGATAALAGVLLLGARKGKYGPNGQVNPIPGANMPLATLGTFILWLGWFGFNPGSTMAAVPEIADIALTTNLAAGAGVLGAMGMSYVYRRHIDVGMGGNGAIAALVAITAPSAFVAPWAAIVIGFVAGVIMYATLVYVDKIGVDDPLGAIAAHGMGGIWGTLSAGLFTTPELATIGQPGLFYGGGFTQLGVQALGIVASGGFVFLASLAVFATLKATIGLRVKPEQELDGLDIHEHGVYGYPDLVATDYQNGNGHSIPDPVESTAKGAV